MAKKDFNFGNSSSSDEVYVHINNGSLVLTYGEGWGDVSPDDYFDLSSTPQVGQIYFVIQDN